MLAVAVVFLPPWQPPYWALGGLVAATPGAAAAGTSPEQAFDNVGITSPAQPGPATSKSENVKLTLNARDLSIWDSSSQSRTIVPGAYQVYAGDSSALTGLPLQAASPSPPERFANGGFDRRRSRAAFVGGGGPGGVAMRRVACKRVPPEPG